MILVTGFMGVVYFGFCLPFFFFLRRTLACNLREGVCILFFLFFMLHSDEGKCTQPVLYVRIVIGRGVKSSALANQLQCSLMTKKCHHHSLNGHCASYTIHSYVTMHNTQSYVVSYDEIIHNAEL